MRRNAIRNRNAIHARCVRLIEDYEGIKAEKDANTTDGADALFEWMCRCALLMDATFPAGHTFVRIASDAVAKKSRGGVVMLANAVSSLRKELEAGLYGELGRRGEKPGSAPEEVQQEAEGLPAEGDFGGLPDYE